MLTETRAYTEAHIFDGDNLLEGQAVLVKDGQIEGLVARNELPVGVDVVELGGGILCPGFVDLQVNGGGGILLNNAPTPSAIKTMAEAHGRLGVTSLLPTLITDTSENMLAAIDAVALSGVEGVAGLHLEGPHLAVEKKGAHSADLIRPMEDEDLSIYLNAASRLPHLKLTVAPEAVTPDQIATLAGAGVSISLGHSNASYEECLSAIKAGASIVTHLFNAMSQLESRAPGLVGAALDSGAISAGLIADGVHVHPASVRAAIAAKQDRGQIFLVSDAMAVAGSDLLEFTLNGRTVRRGDGRLLLEDGTLAGADLDLLTAMRNLVEWRAATLETALAMGTSIPGKLLGPKVGRLVPGASADMVHTTADLAAIKGVWRAGYAVG